MTFEDLQASSPLEPDQLKAKVLLEGQMFPENLYSSKEMLEMGYIKALMKPLKPNQFLLNRLWLCTSRILLARGSLQDAHFAAEEALRCDQLSANTLAQVSVLDRFIDLSGVARINCRASRF